MTMSADEHWLRDLVRHLLEQARHERQAIMMDAIDREKLTEFFGGPPEELDTDKVALSEWEKVIPWNNMPRLGSEPEEKRMNHFAAYVVGLALGNYPDIRPDVAHQIFSDEKENQMRLLDEKIDEYRRAGSSQK